MNRIKIVKYLRKMALLGALCLGAMGCAPQVVTLQPWQAEPKAVSFIATLEKRAQLPLQGGMEVHEQGGRMALVTQHGRTLGQCTWSASTTPIVLHCEPAEGFGADVLSLVQDVAVAAYVGLGQLQGEGHKQEKVFIHNGNSGNIEIKFTGGH